ncbi:transporter substrate-binding domain-containing protein [Permianibacter sp. IMCC34836]|uniref:substrate-binding periplasmic protein n=1 Tax=Permianibacter fluminis TaxID=2738515 RepID=UPI001551EA2E|nr:transporter substrate-binding domain-containing protein [Permianibacter fluminis]NQD35779.1 transporter substrate-binding domain-containing protein [Permianibacter fluminis]
MRVFICLLLLLALPVQADCSREFKTMEREVNQDRIWVARVFAEAGCPLQVLPRAERMLDRFWSLKTGQIDFVSAATPLPERSEFAWFSLPYGREKIVMVTHKELAGQIRAKSMADLLSEQRTIIGPHFGYYGENWPEIKKQLQAVDRFEAYNNWAKARGMLLRNPDGILMIVEDAARDVVAHERPPLVILPVTLSESELVFMFSRKTVTEPEVALINAAITRLLARGITATDN